MCGRTSPTRGAPERSVPGGVPGWLKDCSTVIRLASLLGHRRTLLCSRLPLNARGVWRVASLSNCRIVLSYYRMVALEFSPDRDANGNIPRFRTLGFDPCAFMGNHGDSVLPVFIPIAGQKKSPAPFGTGQSSDSRTIRRTPP